MTVFPSKLGTKIPQTFVFGNKNNDCLKPHVKFLASIHSRNHPKSRTSICCLNTSDRKPKISDEMEKRSNWVQIESDVDEKYAKELEVAVKAVHVACLLCQKVQENLIFNGYEDVQAKDDNSPVTIAGNFDFQY